MIISNTIINYHYFYRVFKHNYLKLKVKTRYDPSKTCRCFTKKFIHISYMWLLLQTFGDNLGNKLRDVNGSCRRQLK